MRGGPSGGGWGGWFGRSLGGGGAFGWLPGPFVPFVGAWDRDWFSQGEGGLWLAVSDGAVGLVRPVCRFPIRMPHIRSRMVGMLAGIVSGYARPCCFLQ